MDDDLWNEVWAYANELYGQKTTDAKRPTKKDVKSSELKDKLTAMSRESEFCVEVPSVRGVPCGCEEKAMTLEDAFYQHQNEQTPYTTDIHEILVSLEVSKTTLQEAYDLLRRPAREILLGVISDLDRTSSDAPYAVPFMYNLSGPSLKMNSMRGLLNERIDQVSSYDLNVKAVAFDGQFLELAVADDEGNPLTLCRLDKKVWEKAKQVSKEKQISYFSNLNYKGTVTTMDELTSRYSLETNSEGKYVLSQSGYQPVYVPQNLTNFLGTPTDKVGQEINQSDRKASDENVESDYILKYLPTDIISELDEDALDAVHAANAAIASSKVSATVSDGVESRLQDPIHPVDVEELLSALQKSKRQSKWISVCPDELRNILRNADSITQNFIVPELELILRCAQNKLIKGRKAKLVNMVCEIYGDGSVIELGYTVPKLRNLSIAALKKMPKLCTNILYATNIYGQEKLEYDQNSYFKPGCCYTIKTDQKEFKIEHWYAQPVLHNGNPIQYFLDPHHVYVNNRCRCCRKGMPQMGINSNAWVKVAQQESTRQQEDKTGLSLEQVIELRDRQRNSFAATTFSESVEKAMVQNGDTTEAYWCRLLRQWYEAMDEAGLTVSQRVEYMMEIRNHLLHFYRPGYFPPPGGDVAGLPIAQFEGIMSNVDRRLQLYALTEKGTYNQRSISSLDSETMFGTFQDIDPKGSGVLRADDIPTALGTAVCIFTHKLDPKRCFPMTTTRKKVYTEHELHASEDISMKPATESKSPYIIVANTHAFDRENRKTKNPKRKSGTISMLSESSRGAQGVRSFHKLNEEKILPHRRAGLNDDQINLP